MLIPLSFIKQTNNSITVHNNAYNLGYKTLTYYAHKFPEASSSIKFENNPDITIFNLDKKNYIFRLENNDGKQYSFSFFLNGENQTIMIKRLLNYIKNPVDEKIITKLLEMNKSRLFYYDSITEGYARKFSEIKDPSESEMQCFYQILYATERLENITAIKENILDITIEYGPILKLNTGAYVTSLDIFKGYKQKNLYRKISVSPYEDIQLILPENDIYYIELCHDTEILGRLVYYSFPETILAWLYENQLLTSQQIDRTIINDIMLKYDDIDFTDEEKEKLIDEKNAFIKNWMVRPPIIMGHDPNDEATIRISIPDYQLLKSLNKDFYLSASDSDIFMEFSCYPWIKIENDIVEFSMNIPNVSNDVVFFIQDAEGNLVSNFTRYYLDSDSYETKKRQLERYEYASSLQKWIDYVFPSNSLREHLKSDIKNTLQTSNGYAIDVLMQILAMLTKDNTYVSICNDVIRCLINHWFDEFDVISNFYNSNNILTYYTATDTMVFPAKKPGYAMVIHAWNLNDEKIETTYISCLNEEATHVNIAKKDYCIIYMIDSETYQKTGYVFISNIIGEYCMTSNKFKIEVNTIGNQ